MTRDALLLTASLAVASSAAPAEQEQTGFKIVVNEAYKGNAVKRETIADVFLKKATRWSSGQMATPVDQSLTSKLRASFSEQVLHQKLEAVQNYWERQIFSGRDRPPPVKSTDAEVLAFVQANPGGIGYVSENAVLPSGVRELKLVE
jgi:ABC-type phosphate transport system substrate-binding protein